MIGSMLEVPWFVFALMGAFFVALSGVIEKDVLKHEEPLHFSGAVAVIGALFSIPFLLFVEFDALTPFFLALIYAVSVLSTLGFSVTAYAMRRLDAGELSSILALTPAATAVFAFFFLGEELDLLHILGIAAVIVGLIVLELPRLMRPMPGKKRSPVYVLVALLAVFIYATSSVLDRFVLHGNGIRAFDFIVLTQLFAVLNFAIIDIVRGKKDRLLTSAWNHRPLKVTLVALLLFLSRLCHAQAISMAYVALASSLKRTGSIFTILLAGRFLGEKGIGHKLFAAALIFIGAIVLIL